MDCYDRSGPTDESDPTIEPDAELPVVRTDRVRFAETDAVIRPLDTFRAAIETY